MADQLFLQIKNIAQDIIENNYEQTQKRYDQSLIPGADAVNAKIDIVMQSDLSGIRQIRKGLQLKIKSAPQYKIER